MSADRKIFIMKPGSFNRNLPGHIHWHLSAIMGGEGGTDYFSEPHLLQRVVPGRPEGRIQCPDWGDTKILIFQTKNLKKVAAILKNTRILHWDFTKCRDFVDEHTFVYLDPPYRPLNHSSSFTSYAMTGFWDGEAGRLATFYRELDSLGAKLILSNSDPKNIDPADSSL